MKTTCRLLAFALLAAPVACAKSQSPAQAPIARCAEPEAAPLDPSTKRDDIRRILELTGSAALARQVMEPMLEQFQKLTPNAPPEFWDELRAKFEDERLLELVTDVYDEELEHEEIVAMREFYESPSGRRITEALPTITAKAQEAGRRWGETIAREIIDDLTAAGYGGPSLE